MYTSTLNCKPSILESNVADKKKEAKKKRLQHESFAYGLPLHYSVSLLAA